MAGVPQTQVVNNSVSVSVKALLVKALPPFGVCFTPCFAPSSSSSVAFAIGLASLSASLRRLGSEVTPRRWRAPSARLAVGWGAKGQYLNSPSFRENRLAPLQVTPGMLPDLLPTMSTLGTVWSAATLGLD